MWALSMWRSETWVCFFFVLLINTGWLWIKCFSYHLAMQGRSCAAGQPWTSKQRCLSSNWQVKQTAGDEVLPPLKTAMKTIALCVKPTPSALPPCDSTWDGKKGKVKTFYSPSCIWTASQPPALVDKEGAAHLVVEQHRGRSRLPTLA